MLFKIANILKILEIPIFYFDCKKLLCLKINFRTIRYYKIRQTNLITNMDVGDTIELQELLTYITNSVYMLLKYI